MSNLENLLQLVDEAHPEMGPVERTGEQGLQADKDAILLTPLHELAEAPIEANLNGTPTIIPYTHDTWEPLSAIPPYTAWGTLTLSLHSVGLFFRYVTSYAMADGIIPHAPVKELAGLVGQVIANILHHSFPTDPAHYTTETSPWKREAIVLQHLEKLRSPIFWQDRILKALDTEYFVSRSEPHRARDTGTCGSKPHE